MWVLFDQATGAQIGDLLAEEPTPAPGQAVVAAPPSLAAGISVWNPVLRGAVDPPRLTGAQILALYTPAQHARARRMISATYPPGHAMEGQLVDPDGLVQRLVDFTLALQTALPVTDPYHINGTALLRSLGVIESDAEAARILAGIPAPGM